MVWKLTLLLFVCAGVLAIKKDGDNSNSIVLEGRGISMNTSTSGLHDAVGDTLVPGPGFLQEIKVGNVPSLKGPLLPGLGKDVVITSKSTHSKNGEENTINSRIQSVTNEPRDILRRLWKSAPLIKLLRSI
ncbi:uncharacterized protein LOC119554768 isoform X2 [Drosophila subpulchrella]|uniref:uncharacterized protein LOC119554768 isoform X2 n=1 Tax=Drosophila subpulchrella TaxID=1486046 RepID=UPI0018A19C16|nr:uncharacterized protein LOC119554768 isoform X2 [Drosophila subpulchrella]